MLLAAFIILILLGLALIAIGLRGHVVRHGPTCRACSFDLSGLATPLVTCPECGKSLALARAVRPSLRRRRTISLVMGVLVLGGLGAAGVVVSRASFASPPVQGMLPAWVLTLELKYASPGLGTAASSELCTRIQKRAIDDASVRSFVAWGLEAHADPQLPWTVAQADVVEIAKAVGAIDDAMWVRYLEQVVHLSVYAPKVVRKGSTVLMGVTVDSALIATSHVPLFFQLDASCLKIGDEESKVEIALRSSLSGVKSSRNNVEIAAGIGKHVLAIPLTMRITQGSEAVLPIAVLNRTITAPIQVVAADADVLPKRTEPDLASQIKSTLTLLQVSQQGYRVKITQNVSRPLPDIGVQLEIRFRDKDGVVQRVQFGKWRLGDRMLGVSSASVGGGSWSELGAAGAAGLKTVDVAIIASSAISEECEASEYWPGEIVYEDVPFEYVPLALPMSDVPSR